MKTERISIPFIGKSAAQLLMAGIMVILLSGCSPAGKSLRGAGNEKCETGCWTDGDTYRIHAASRYSGNSGKRDERRLASKGEAVKNARRDILLKFRGMITEQAGHLLPSGESAEQNARRVMEIIDGGKVIQVGFDDDDNCEVLFEVRGSGLRNMVYHSTLYRE